MNLIDQTLAFAADGLARTVGGILEKRIGSEKLTLHELFREHAVYFGFTSLDGKAKVSEQCAFVCDERMSWRCSRVARVMLEATKVVLVHLGSV